MSLEKWNQYVDFYLRGDRVTKSIVNKGNRRKQKYSSIHGSKSYVEYRYDRRLKNGSYPSLIEGFGLHHTKGGKYVNQEAERNHTRMKELESAQIGSANPVTDVQILEQVLGTRRGHNRGRGRIIRGTSDLNTQSQPVGRVYTQAEVDTMFKAQRSKMKKQMEAVQSQQTAILNALHTQGIQVSFPSSQNLSSSCSPSDSTQLSDKDESGEEDESGDEGEEQFDKED